MVIKKGKTEDAPIRPPRTSYEVLNPSLHNERPLYNRLGFITILDNRTNIFRNINKINFRLLGIESAM